MKAPPQRIISITPSNTEILYALGLEDRVVAVSDFCNYPPAASEKPRIGGMIDFNIERITLFDPDFVLAVKGNPEERLKQLHALKIPVFAFDPRRLQDIYATILRVGRITGANDEAKALVSQMRERIENVRQAIAPEQPRKRIYFGSIRAPYYSANAETFVGEIFDIAGGANVAADSSMRWPQLTTENLLVSDPEVVFVGLSYDGEQKIDAKEYRDYFDQHRMWSLTSAGRRGAVHFVDRDLLERPGPRIVEGAEAIARLLYPERFPSEQGSAADGE